MVGHDNTADECFFENVKLLCGKNGITKLSALVGDVSAAHILSSISTAPSFHQVTENRKLIVPIKICNVMLLSSTENHLEESFFTL